MQEIIVGKNDSGQRADKFLKKFLPVASAGFIYKMMRKKKIKLNNCRIKPSQIVKEGDLIQLYFSTETLEKFTSEVQVAETGIDFSIVYQDENIIVVHKPVGMLSHSDGRQEETLIDQLVYYLFQKGEYLPESEKSFVPALCNRLDRNTGGLIIGAKNFSALQDMNYMIKQKWVDKYYKTVVIGKIEEEKEIQGFLVKDGDTNSVEIASKPVKGSKKIRTFYRPISYNNTGYTLLEVQLITGRPHQIRAHLADMGHPIIGDYKYGDRKANRLFRDKYGLGSQFLYAHRIVFRETTSKFAYLKGMKIEGVLPEYFRIIEEELFD